MIRPIPCDPTALMAARLTIALVVFLIVLAVVPHQDAPLAPVVRAQAPRAPAAATPTAQSVPAPPEPAQAPAAQPAAPTAAPAIAQAPAAPPAPQLVHNADGSVSLPGSEAWMQPQNAAPNADPQLQIERDAAAAYQQLPTAAAPSVENAQPNRVRRPYTGR